jgi:hypothetical protein
MKRKFLIISSLSTLMFVSSCVEYSNELDSLNYEPTIVIDGLVVDTVGQSYVRISLSSPNGDSLNSYPINDATVEIIEDGNIFNSFELSCPGVYCDSLFCAKMNSTYTMHVVYKGKEYSAISKLMPVTNIDSLVYVKIDSISADINEYKVYIYANRTSADFTSYYKIKLFRNDSLYNAYSDLLLIDDLLFDSFRNLEFPYTFQSRDTVRADLYSLTQEVYFYFEELSGLTNGNINSIYFYPQNPTSNISNGALGIFQTSSVSSNEIILP